MAAEKVSSLVPDQFEMSCQLLYGPCHNGHRNWKDMSKNRSGTRLSSVQNHYMLFIRGSHKDMQELEDAFVGEDVQDVARLWVDHRQPMDLILQQRIDGIKKAVENKRRVVLTTA